MSTILHVCFICKKSEADTTLQQCSGCKARTYCGTTCQLADWPTHKKSCKKSPTKWYDKYRKCDDGNTHEGRMELITWSCPEEETGWGNCFEEESDDLRRKLEVEFNGDLEKFYGYWPQGFRWTCCGTSADMKYGCDHHGSGSKACTCDFCRMGKPLPDSVYNDRSASRMGLRLPRGPDPRSFNVGMGFTAATMRSTMGLEM